MTRLIWSNYEPTAATLRRRKGRRPEPQALRAGDAAPGFRLLDQHGRLITLAGLLATGPAVLRFSGQAEGAADFREFDEMVEVDQQIEREGATLAVIARPLAPRPPDWDPAAYDFRLLADPGGKVARAYGLRLPAPRAVSAGDAETAPATFIIDRSFVVGLAFVDYGGRSRMAPDEILTALDCLNRRDGAKSPRPDPPI